MERVHRTEKGLYREEGLYTKNALHVGEEGYTYKLQPWIKPACLSDNNILKEKANLMIDST